MNANTLRNETNSPESFTQRVSAMQLPPLKFHDWDMVSTQLATYFRKLLEDNLVCNQVHCLQVPSLLTLAEIFGCCEMDVFDALYELKQQAYTYQFAGIDAPITLRDPLFRKPTNIRRPERRGKWFKRLTRGFPFKDVSASGMSFSSQASLPWAG